jgi:hypothetical protein
VRSLLFLVFCAALARASVFGIGGHYLANLGSSLEGGAGYVKPDLLMGLGSIQVKHSGTSLFSGFGFKAWTEAVPFVDLELTANAQMRSYNAWLFAEDFTYLDTNFSDHFLDTPRDSVEMIANFGIPLISNDTTKPIFSLISLELSVSYPFELPPPFHFLRPYLGAGLDLVWSTPVLNASFGEMFWDYAKLDTSLAQFKESNREALKTKLSEELSRYLDEEGLEFGVGAHLLAGVRIKIPALPIALYVNGKYHFGGGMAREFRQGLVLEAGGGLDL